VVHLQQHVATHRISFGSRASRIESPMIMNEIVIVEMKIAGQTNRCGVSRYEVATPNCDPQEIDGGCSPTPRNVRTASSPIRPPMPRVVIASSGAIAFGNTCLRRIRNGGTPIERAARTYSRLRTEKTVDRMIRMPCGQAVTRMIATMIQIL